MFDFDDPTKSAEDKMSAALGLVIALTVGSFIAVAAGIVLLIHHLFF